jgi:DNA-binding PadR family transcriptional regulator
MAARRPTARDLVALAVLALLTERPSHPYQMHRTIRERRHDDFLSGLPRSLYHAVDRLTRAGLVEPAETTREGLRPERTVLRLTVDGHEELRSWVAELLSTPGPADAFAAALTYSFVLDPETVTQNLSFRAAQLAGRVAELDAQLTRVRDVLPRALLLDHDYRLTLCRAELAWVESLIAAIVSGDVNWDFLQKEEATDELTR